ncbi:MAG: T9SS type A sorting domain-containing protein [Chitinophagaceae bacterium]|nr:T9SS type A sorting domain-containing protein [Chitinophagaceae bacterium]
MPGYFYIPNGLDKIYFNVLNSFSNGKYASADAISKSFNIKDNYGNLIKPRFVTPKDSTLFYLEIPQTANGTFWQATTMGQYNLQFVNISNLLWYATPAGFEKANSLMANEKEELIASVFPNPSTGMFKCIKEGQLVTAESITILSAEGTRVATFKNVNEFNVSNLAAGVYLYTMQINGKLANGRLVKL